MSEIFQWAEDILIILIALSFFQILIPESSMAKYLQFIFSLVVLAVILEPIVLIAGQIGILK